MGFFFIKLGDFFNVRRTRKACADSHSQDFVFAADAAATIHLVAAGANSAAATSTKNRGKKDEVTFVH